MSQRTGLDEWSRLDSSALLVPTRSLRLLRKEQHEARPDAVSNCIDATALLDSISVLLLGGVNGLVQDRHDAVLGDTGQPHVDEERLGDFNSLELELLKDRSGVVGDGGGGGGRVTSEQVRHEDEIALARVLVSLDLIVDRLYTGAAREEEKETGRGVGIVYRLRDVDLV